MLEEKRTMSMLAALLSGVSGACALDTVPPDAVFEAVPPALVNSNKVSFSVRNDGDSVAWHCVVTNAWGGVVADRWLNAPAREFSVTVPDEDGDYFIALLGRDAAGNMRREPVRPGGVFSWRLDRQAPYVPGARFVLSGMPLSPTNQAAVTVVLAKDADLAEWRVTLKKQVNGTWAFVTNVWAANLYGGTRDTQKTVRALATDGSQDGRYRLEVVGRDAAGNWQALPVSGGVYEWEYDRTPPAAVFSQTPVSPLTVPAASFTVADSGERCSRWKYRVTENGVTRINWTVVGTPVFSVAVPDSGMSTGAVYRIEVLGCDAAGNWQASPVAAGIAEWQVAPANRYFTKIVRNTVATNGNLRVEVVVTLRENFPGQVILDERLPLKVASVSYWKANEAVVAPVRQTVGTAPTNVLKWAFSVASGACTAKFYYEIPGLASNNLAASLKWNESGSDKTLAVAGGTHVVAGTATVPPLTGFAAWAAALGLGTDSRSSDADGDGLSNEAEYWADTDPKSAASQFRVEEIGMEAGSSAAVAVSAGPSAVLAVDYKTALSDPDWRPVTPDYCSYQGGNLWLIVVPVWPQAGGVSETAAYFRVQALNRDEQ